MSNTRFAIEWIYSEFQISRFSGGQTVESWSAPYPVNDLGDLNVAMHDASQHIDLNRSGAIAIAYEDDLHTHEFVSVPDISRRDLEKFLQRRVEHDKPFQDEAAWCYHSASRGHSNQGVLLHLLPKRIVDAVIRICEEYYLQPKRLVPLTEILSEHVAKLNAEATDILLLVALFNQRVQMLVSRGDGEILLVRELTHSLQQDSVDRLIVEINRTIGYIKQRIGSQLARVSLIGRQSTQVIEQLKLQLNAPVEVDETATADSFWMSEVAGLPQKLSSNFIPRLAQRAITRKAGLRVTVLAAAGLMLASLIVFTAIETFITKNQIDSAATSNEIASLNQKITNLRHELQELESNRLRLNQLTADAFNLPAVFLSHMGDLVPKEITLTHAGIARNQGHWTVELSGTSRLRLSELPAVLTTLESNLSGDPWNMQITESWQTTWMEQLRNGGATSQSEIGFKIKGQLQ